MALFVDKLKIANILVNGDVPREQAEQFAEAISEELSTVATDESVEEKIAALDAKTDARFQAMMARMDARFAELQAQIDTRFAEVNSRFAQMEVRMYRFIFASAVVVIGVISAWQAFG